MGDPVIPQKSRIVNLDILYCVCVSFFSFSIIAFISLALRKSDSGDGFGAASVASSAYSCRADSRAQAETVCLQNLFAPHGDESRIDILVFGNSQLAAINQASKGENTYAHMLTNAFHLKKYKLLSLWMPNASFREFQELYDALDECGVTPGVLVIPAFLDDTREAEVRSNVSNLDDLLCPQKVSSRFIVSDQAPTQGMQNASSLTSSDPSSNAAYSGRGNLSMANSLLKKRLGIFTKLQQINTLVREQLYFMRNAIFGITPDTVRPIKTASLKSNLESLRGILDKRSAGHHRTLLYIPPLLNSDGAGPIPYDHQDYAHFKSTIKTICESRVECSFFNLEEAVPNHLWGTKNSTNLGGESQEIDFMHFTYDGHLELFRRLELILVDLTN